MIVYRKLSRMTLNPLWKVHVRERSAQCLLPAVSDSKHCDEGQQVTSRLGKITSREDKVHSPDSLQYWKSIYFHFSETLGPSPPHPLSSTYSSDRHPRSSVSKLSPEHCQGSHCSVSLLNSDKSDKSNNDKGGGPSWIQFNTKFRIYQIKQGTQSKILNI